MVTEIKGDSRKRINALLRDVKEQCSAPSQKGEVSQTVSCALEALTEPAWELQIVPWLSQPVSLFGVHHSKV